MSAPDDQVAALLARMQETADELDRVAAAQLAEWDQAKAGWAEEDEQRATLARRGDLGPQWQRLQRRIDLEETSVSEVLRGVDPSVDAEIVRTEAQQRAEVLGEQLREADEEGEVPVLQQQRAEMAELTAALDELRILTGHPPRHDGPRG